MSAFVLAKIISGGQTGADRGALDAAIGASFPYGGALPAGRLSEEGPLPENYDLDVLDSPNYAVRTERNVLDGDGTLIVSHGPLTGGSALTRSYAEQHGRPCLHVDLDELDLEQAFLLARQWLQANEIAVLNVAGPRASSDPAIYGRTRELIGRLIAAAEAS